MRNYLDFSNWHKNWWPRLLKFGVPLMPAGIVMYVLNTSDRWFINYYWNQNALGLYSAGAKLALIISLAVTAFRQAWWPVSMDAMHSKDGPLFFKSIARLYLGFGSVAVVFISALSPCLVKWFLAPAYHSAYPIVGILAWSAIFFGFYLIAAGGIWKMEKTKWAPLLMGAASILNIVLNAYLVPKYGGIGAAMGTSISFFVWNVLAVIVSEKLWNVGYNYRTMSVQVAVGAAACYLILFILNKDFAYWTVWPICILTIVGLIFITFDNRHFKLIASLIKTKNFLNVSNRNLSKG